MWTNKYVRRPLWKKEKFSYETKLGCFFPYRDTVPAHHSHVLRFYPFAGVVKSEMHQSFKPTNYVVNPKRINYISMILNSIIWKIPFDFFTFEKFSQSTGHPRADLHT